MDRFAAMRAFVEIVDRGSLTAAAMALERSQSSVARTLAALEAHLGVVLLRRTTRRMALTVEGEDYLVRARQILADLEDAERALGDRDVQPRGQLRLAAPVEFGRRFVTPLVAQALADHPELRIDLQLLDRVVDMLEEGVDLAVRIGPLADSSMIAVPVGQVQRMICASPDLLAAVGVPEVPEAMAGLPAIRMHNRVGNTWVLRRDGREQRLSVNSRFSCNAIAPSVAACVAGVGFGQFLSYQVHELLAAGRLVQVLAAWAPAPVPVNLVYPSGRLKTARLRAVLDRLRDGLRGEPSIYGLPEQPSGGQ